MAQLLFAVVFVACVITAFYAQGTKRIAFGVAALLCLIVIGGSLHRNDAAVRSGGAQSEASTPAIQEAATPESAATPDSTATPEESDDHMMGRSIQGWAVGYAHDNPDLNGLFTGTVSSDDGTTKIVTDANTWASLTSDEQNAIKVNALNALEESYCLIPDHKGEMIPGIGFQFVDSQGNILDWKVTPSGLSCN
jgi:hypothetical protein